MGSAASISSLRDHEAEEVINKCAALYTNDPMYFEFVIAEAKKRAANTNPSEVDSKGNSAADAAAISASQAAQDSSYTRDEEKAVPPADNVAGNSIDLLSVINRVRSQPIDFIPDLQKHMDKFIDETIFQLKTEGKTINIRTNEGKAAVQEAIEFLKTCPSVAPITYSSLLEKAALDHVSDISRNKVTGHEVN